MKTSAVLLALFASVLMSASRADPEGAAPEGSWTLERCRDEALSASHRIASAGHEVDRAEAAAREAEAVRWPVLELGGSYAYASETMALSLNRYVPLDLPEVRFGDGNTYDVKLQLTAPLFTGGALRYRARAEAAGAEAAREDSSAANLRLVQEVRRAFYSALGAEAQAKAARVAEGRMRRHVEEIEGALRAGAASEENRVQALARFRQAEQLRTRAESFALGEKLGLGRLVGLPGRPIEPAGDLERSLLPDGIPGDTTAKTRPELAALSARAARSEDLGRAARGAYFPTLAAQAAYHHAKPGVDAIENEWMQYGTVGVTLSWPLWEWGARSERVRAARASASALNEQRADLEDQLEAGREAARVRLRSAVDEEAKAAERVALEKRRSELVENRYRQGSASESEFLDAEDDRAAAEIDRALAAAAIRQAEAELLYLLGR
jgi:outer membrane protein TolC